MKILSPLTFLIILIVSLASGAKASDCNSNGFDDAEELASGAASDCNGNSVPDFCV